MTKHSSLFVLFNYLLLISFLLSPSLGQTFQPNVTYGNRTTVVANLSSTTAINQVYLADTNLDTAVDAVVVGPSTLLSIRQQVPTSATVKYQQPFLNYSSYIRGIESVGYLKGVNGTGWLVVANSRGSLPQNPVGAVQLIREVSNSTVPIRNATLIPNTNFRNISGLVNGRQIKIVDVNNDGLSDIIVSVDGISSTNTSVGILVLFRNKDGKGNFERIVLSDTLYGRTLIDYGDCDQNGKIDIIVLGLDSKRLDVFYQERNSTFTRKLIDANVGTGTNYALTVGSFQPNLKSRSDIFIVGPTSMTGYLTTTLQNITNYTALPDSAFLLVRQFTKNPLFNFQSLSLSTANYREYSIRLVDCDNDGLVDIVTTLGKKFNNIQCFRSLPNGYIDWYYPIINVTGPTTFDIADVNKDGLLDYIVHSSIDRAVYLFTGKKRI